MKHDGYDSTVSNDPRAVISWRGNAKRVVASDANFLRAAASRHRAKMIFRKRKRPRQESVNTLVNCSAGELHRGPVQMTAFIRS